MDSWVIQRVGLAYQLSDLTIARIPVALKTTICGLVASAVENPLPPKEPLSPGARGYMLRGLPLAAQVPVVSRVSSYLRYVPLQYRHCYIDMAGDFEAYRQKFSSKTRSTIVRKVKKYAEHSGGTISWRRYASAEEIKAFLPLARELSAKTYQERLLDAGLPNDEAFTRQALEDAAANRVRAFLLFDGERPVSYLYCPIRDGVVIYAYLGYDPAYQKMSVGTVLQWLALEQLFGERSFKCFDFTEGESDHKRLFATHDQLRANVMFIRADVRGYLLVFSHRLMNHLSESVGRALSRWGLKSRIKKLLRFGSRS